MTIAVQTLNNTTRVYSILKNLDELDGKYASTTSRRTARHGQGDHAVRNLLLSRLARFLVSQDVILENLGRQQDVSEIGQFI